MKKIFSFFLLSFLLLGGLAQALEIVRQKNAATVIAFPITNTTGAMIVNATGLTSQYSSWSDTTTPSNFTNTNQTVTQIQTSGRYYLNLTQAEMGADYLYLKITSNSSGAADQDILIRTMVGDPLNFAVTDDGGAINVTNGIIDTVTTVANVTTVNGLAANVITATAINSSAITNASFAAGAIDASVIAANAITSSEFAQSAADLVWSTGARTLTAGTNIVLAKGTGITGFNDITAANVWDTNISVYSGAGYAGTYLKALYDKRPATGNMLDDATWTGTKAGYLDAAISSRLSTAGYTAPDNTNIINIINLLRNGAGYATCPVNKSIWDALGDGTVRASSSEVAKAADYTSARSAKLDNLDATISSRSTYSGGAVASVTGNVGGNVVGTIGGLATQAKTDAENAIWEATATSHNNAGTMGQKLNSAASAGDPWTTALPGAYGAGTAGYILGNRLDAAVSSRSSHSAADVATAILVTPANKLATDASNRVTVGSNADKTGYSLTQSFPANFSSLAITAGGAVTAGNAGLAATDIDNIWEYDKTLSTGASAIGKHIVDNLNAAVGSRSTLTDGQVWGYPTRILTANTNFNDPSAASIAGAVWNEPLAGYITAGTAGKKLSDIPTSGVGDWTSGEKTLIKQSLGINDGIVDTGGNLDAIYQEIRRTRGR